MKLLTADHVRLIAAIVLTDNSQLAAGIKQKGLATLRSREELEAAVGSVRTAYGYAPGDCFLVAAQYADAVARHHPFADGNKRIAWATAMTYLRLFDFVVDEGDGTFGRDLMVGLVRKRLKVETVARRLAERAQLAFGSKDDAG